MKRLTPSISHPNIRTSLSLSWLTSSARLGSEGQLSEFIEGLGPGQLVGRQVLASPALGDIQLSMRDVRGHLEVEVIRARGLQCKAGSKTLPGMKKSHEIACVYHCDFLSFQRPG